VAQYVYDIVDVDGLRFPTKRRAYLRGPHLKPIRDLLLVSITFDANKFRLDGSSWKIQVPNEDIKKDLLQSFVLIIKSICYFATVILPYKQVTMLPRCNSPMVHRYGEPNIPRLQVFTDIPRLQVFIINGSHCHKCIAYGFNSNNGIHLW